ncbi:hypothetical protein [Geopseudomonas aromaticivorans]
MDLRFCSLSPLAQPDRLIIPDVRLVTGPPASGALTRLIGDDCWRHMLRAPEIDGGFSHLSETAWVARCLLSHYDKGLVDIASENVEQLLPGDIEAAQQIIYDFAQMHEGDGSAIWVLTLSMMALEDPCGVSQALLDHACQKHPRQAPRMAAWTNIIALLGSRPSYAYGVHSLASTPQMLARMINVIHPDDLGRHLADIQTFHDPSLEFKQMLRQAGLGRLVWRDDSGAIDPDDMAEAPLFHRPVDALRWLTESITPAAPSPAGAMPSSPRHRMRPIREMIRAGGLKLINVERESPLLSQDVLRLLDALLAPSGTWRAPPELAVSA